MACATTPKLLRMGRFKFITKTPTPPSNPAMKYIVAGCALARISNLDIVTCHSSISLVLNRLLDAG
jgi:hypothetical protein